jgi:hypothetical protein
LTNYFYSIKYYYRSKFPNSAELEFQAIDLFSFIPLFFHMSLLKNKNLATSSSEVRKQIQRTNHWHEPDSGLQLDWQVEYYWGIMVFLYDVYFIASNNT